MGSRSSFVGLGHLYEAVELRVIAQGPSFAELVALAFDQIRQNAESNTAILTKMLSTLEQLLDVRVNIDQRTALVKQVGATVESVERTVESSYACYTVEAQPARASQGEKRPG